MVPHPSDSSQQMELVRVWASGENRGPLIAFQTMLNMAPTIPPSSMRRLIQEVPVRFRFQRSATKNEAMFLRQVCTL